MTRQLHIGFGPLQLPLVDQIKQQGFECDESVIGRIEKQRHAVNTLYIPGVMTESQHDAITKKLNKEVVKHVEEMNP